MEKLDTNGNVQSTHTRGIVSENCSRYSVNAGDGEETTYLSRTL